MSENYARQELALSVCQVKTQQRKECLAPPIEAEAPHEPEAKSPYIYPIKAVTKEKYE